MTSHRSVARRIASAMSALLLAWTFMTALVRAEADDSGILLLAHGGKVEWNETVTALRGRLDRRVPTEVAFGMATRSAIQAGIDRLVQRGVKQIVAVPLFISSHSSVIDATEYLIGARKEAPAALRVFARMDHGGGAQTAHGAGRHAPAEYGTRPVESPVPIRMTAALNRHPIVTDILASRAKAISRDPRHEVAIVVAHGPVSDEENALWLADMRVLAERLGRAVPFARVEALTVRDDAPAPVKAAATAELRQMVIRASSAGNRVLIVPLLLSYGGIESGIRTRLSGLDYVMAEQGLMPDDRIAQWVFESANLSSTR